jgi:fructose-bisphosphate aldolase, class I
MGTERDLESLLGDEAEALLGFSNPKIARGRIHLPGPDFVDRIWKDSDRPTSVLRALQALVDHGRLGGTGYLSMLPVDHGIAFSAGSAFAPNPAYFDPEAVLTLAIEAGCSAVVTTFGVLGAVARRYAHRVPLVLKLNHHETLSYPNRSDQVMFARVRNAFEMGCVAVGATVYFGSPESRRQLREVSEAFAEAHALGMATVLFCYLHPFAFHRGGVDYAFAADLTGQANHFGATVEADLIKQKLPVVRGGFRAVSAPDAPYGSPGEAGDALAGEHPIDLTRYQVACSFMGRCGLINSGGGAGADDFAEAVRTAVVNKRAGGMGLIAGRKAFQRPLRDGVRLIHAVQDVYLDARVTVA